MSRIALALALVVALPTLAVAAPATVTIGLPPPEARGVYDAVFTDLTDGTESPFTAPFAGEANVRAFDAAGREVVADLWTAPGGSGAAVASFSVGDLPPLENPTEVDFVFRSWFHPGVPRPFAYTASSGVSARSSASPTAVADAESGGFDVVAYGDSDAACRFRNPLQGRTVADGDLVPATDLCTNGVEDAPPYRASVVGGLLRLDGPDHSQTTVNGDVTSYDGNVTYWFADGFPFPILIHSELPCTARCGDDKGFVIHRNLARYDPGDVPPRPPADAPAIPAPQLAPVGRWGPTDGDGLAWPLSEAHAAAAAHPLLTGFRAYLAAHADAVLVRAEYHGPESAAGSETWNLVYSDPSASAWRVVLERPAGAPPMTPVRAEESAVPNDSEPPAVGPRDLPAFAPTLADAVEAWRAAYGDLGAVDSIVWSATGEHESYVQPEEPFVGAGRLLDRTGSLGAATTTRTEHFLTLGVDGLRAGVFEASYRRGFLTDLPLYTAPATGATSTTDAATLRAMSAGAWLGVAGGGGLLLALLLLLEPLRHALWRAVLVPLFSRLDRSDVLDNEARRRVLDVVRTDPGVNASELLERAAVSGGVGGYHLGVLEREGYLTAVETSGFRRYYLTGSMDATAMRRDAALRAGSNAKVHALIRAEPGIRLTDLAKRAGLSVAACSKTVRALEKAGLVAKERHGREVALRSA